MLTKLISSKIFIPKSRLFIDYETTKSTRLFLSTVITFDGHRCAVVKLVAITVAKFDLIFLGFSERKIKISVNEIGYSITYIMYIYKKIQFNYVKLGKLSL